MPKNMADDGVALPIGLGKFSENLLFSMRMILYIKVFSNRQNLVEYPAGLRILYLYYLILCRNDADIDGFCLVATPQTIPSNGIRRPTVGPISTSRILSNLLIIAIKS